jgi:hypothetical protein
MSFAIKSGWCGTENPQRSTFFKKQESKEEAPKSRTRQKMLDYYDKCYKEASKFNLQLNAPGGGRYATMGELGAKKHMEKGRISFARKSYWDAANQYSKCLHIPACNEPIRLVSFL